MITRLLNGGADENTVLSCNHGARAGHKVFLVHGADTHAEILAAVDPRVERISVPALVQPVSPIADLRALIDLRRIFRRIAPDIVHTHTSKAGILGRLAARAARVPTIVHGVHIVPFVNVGRIAGLVYRFAERRAANVTDAFVDVGYGVRDICLASGIGSLDQHHVIQSGFDLERFRDAQPPADWRELLRLRSDQARPPVLLMLAAFEPRKRHLEFLERFPEVVARLPDVRLVLGGDGALRRTVERRILELGIEGNVVLTGFYPRPEELIALADVCLLASAREGLPRVVIQYLAGGKPVVASDLPGLGEVLRSGVNGVIVPADDLDGLMDSVVALLEDDDRRAELARGAAATDLSAWDAELMAKRIDAVYAELLRGRNRRQPLDVKVAVSR